jgi:DNA-binding transcriptional ArsR family regulator
MWLLLIHHRMAMTLARVSTDRVFKSLADPTRLAILERLLREGEQSVVALTARAGVSQPAVSKHLAVLKRAGLVRHRRDGREARYRARPEGLAPVIDWMKHYSAFWGDRFDRLDDLLRRMNP